MAVWSASEDSALIAGHLNGDRRALEQLMAHHTPHLRSHLARLLSYVAADERHAQIDDIIQDTWIRVHNHSAGFDQTCKFTTWLYTIATNLARNAYRDRTRRKTMRWPVWQNDDGELIEAEFPDTRTDAQPDTAFDLNDLATFVDQKKHLLPPKHRQVLELRLGGMRYEEMATTLGIELGTVKSRLARARRAMAEMWEQHGAH